MKSNNVMRSDAACIGASSLHVNTIRRGYSPVVSRFGPKSIFTPIQY